jgi:hypothetical protein
MRMDLHRASAMYDAGAVGGTALPLDFLSGQAPRIRLALERLQDLLPQAISLPSCQAVIAGLVGSIALGQVSPGRTGSQDPKDAIDDGAMVLVAPAAFVRVILGRQERLDALPGCVGQVTTSHACLRHLQEFFEFFNSFTQTKRDSSDTL